MGPAVGLTPPFERLSFFSEFSLPKEARVINQDQEQLRQMSTAELVKHAVEEARLLAKAEILHAKNELREEIADAKRSGLFMGAALVLALCGLSALFVALGLALPLTAGLGVALVGVAQLAIAGALGFAGFKKLPKKPLNRTIDRIKTDIEVTREQFA